MEGAARPAVSAKSYRALSEAAERLLGGRPARTDGRLVKENLWKETQVSRATMNRATDLLREWDARVTAAGGRTPGEAGRGSEASELRGRLRKTARERDELRRQVDAAATVIAVLHSENAALRDRLSRRGPVVPLGGRSAGGDQPSCS